jgi:hypothetical protein
LQTGIADWKKAVQSKTPDVAPVAAYNLSVAFGSLGYDSTAVFYATLSKKMGYKVDSAYLCKLVAKKLKGNK